MNVALIGLGMVARTHVRALQAAGLTLRSVMAREAARVDAFADAVGRESGRRPRAVTDIGAIADDPDIGFVILCTPPDARRAFVERLVEAGKPILMEKPIERTFAAASALVALCEGAGVPLGIVLQHRMRASARELRERLDAGALGRVALVEIRVPWWREQAYYDEPGRGSHARDGGGVLISQAIHTLDLALSLAGPVGAVQAMARTTALHAMEAEDHVSAGLDFTDGAVGTLVASTACYPGAGESIALHGSEGSAVLEPGRVDFAFRDGRRESVGESAASGGGADPMAFTHEWHQAIVEDFAAALAEGREPAVSGRAALGVHALIDALVRSSAEERLVTLADASDDPRRPGDARGNSFGKPGARDA